NLGYFLEMKQVDCVGNPNYIADVHCRILPPLNRSVEASVNIVQRLSNGFSGTLRVAIPVKKVVTSIIDITFDVCKALREGKRRMLIDLIVNTLARTSNGAKYFKCPFPKGKFESKNLTITDLPPMLTESDFLVNLDFFFPRVAAALNITIQGHLYDMAKERARRKKFL
ncbi:hypothetical protein KR018_005105, partial [Drosophila ironensis]